MPKGKRKSPVKIVCGFCGKEWDSYSTNSRTKYCSDGCRDNGRKRSLDTLDQRLGRLVNGAKYRAKSKGLPFDITKDFLKGLWASQHGKCAVTGYEFDLTYQGGKQHGWSKRNAPSIDRVVPELGYVIGNIRLVTYQVNMAKGTYTDEEFYDMCAKALGGVAR